MDLKEVYRSVRTFEAQLLATRLESEGLHPVLVGANLASMIGAGLNPIIPCRVMVPESELNEATAMMAVLDAMDEPGQAGPEKCPACGEAWEPGFQECWSCQTPLETS